MSKIWFQKWIQATNIRLRLIQTKTMLGDLMSVAQGDSTVTRRVRNLLLTSYWAKLGSITLNQIDSLLRKML